MRGLNLYFKNSKPGGKRSSDGLGWSEGDGGGERESATGNNSGDGGAAQPGLGGGTWSEIGTGGIISFDPDNDPSLSSVGEGVSEGVYVFCDNNSAEPGLGGGKWSGFGGGST